MLAASEPDFDLSDRGALHKAVNLENEVHIIEETQLFEDSEPVQTLLLSSKKVKSPPARSSGCQASDPASGGVRGWTPPAHPPLCQGGRDTDEGS